MPFLKVREGRDCLAKSPIVSMKTQCSDLGGQISALADRGQAHPGLSLSNLGEGKGKSLGLEGQVAPVTRSAGQS